MLMCGGGGGGAEGEEGGEARTKTMTGGVAIDPNEWRERVDSVVSSMDELARAGRWRAAGRRGRPRPLTTTAKSPGPGATPLATLGGAWRIGPMTSAADVARSHVERVLLRTGARGDSGDAPEQRRSTVRVEPATDRDDRPGVVIDDVANSRSVADGGCDGPSPPTRDGDGGADESEEEDAYRLAMAFGSNAADDDDDDEREGASSRKTIERRLEMLVGRVNAAGGGDEAGPNVDGAPSYLKSLLRTLIRPPESGVWLIDKSRVKDAPLMLRRGRTALVSFLIAIEAPGWKDAVVRLASSPVPSYLGYLSPSEDYRSSRSRGKEQLVHRSSYFLPAMESGDMSLPPSPIVTEVGLSMCVRNFLHGDAPAGEGATSYQSSLPGGLEIFRNRGSADERENLPRSLRAPLPDANELACDLFDLTLRLAADDDSEHESKPFPLRLAIPSASESLTIILRVVSDHSDWLSPVAIAPRYRFVLQRIIQSSRCLGATNFIERPSDDHPDSPNEGFLLWSKRASFLIEATAVTNRGRMALITTQFMMLLCSRKRNEICVASFPNPKQPHFYARLQLHKSSHFWTEIDKRATNVPSNVMARVFDQNFAMRFLLPLAFQCTLLLSALSKTSWRNESISAQIQGSQSVLLVLSSVLDVLANYEVLCDCIHMGWAVQIFALSFSHFVFGEDFHFRNREMKTLSACDTSSDSVWESLSCQLNSLYFSVWGRDRHNYTSQSHSQTSAKRYIYHETVGRDCNGSARMVVLLPSKELFFASLIEFACSFRSEPDGVEGFCWFIGDILFDHYSQALQSCAYPKSGCDDTGYSYQHEFSLLSDWIGALASKLQEIVCKSIKMDEQEGETSTEKVLHDLITPLLKALHRRIMGRMLRARPSRQQNENDSHYCESSSNLVASIFVRLYKQEVEQFAKKSSSAKTRRWRVYMNCLEKIFMLTPPNFVFACHGYSALTEYAAETLTEIWNQFGQLDHSHSIFIMVAAALHVDACAKEDKLLLSQDDLSRQAGFLSRQEVDLSLRLKQLYKNFSSHAKNCIINSIGGADVTNNFHSQSQNKIHTLVWGVRRELAVRGEFQGALEWWNEISVDLFSALNKSIDHALDHEKSDATSKNIMKACSSLQSNLSIISAISHQIHPFNP
ncbi:hypothetical protein ACHAW5_003294 [Stephanodiscus triporus]|uniref:Uncharacterized protein n=1 Tax=Stephanodiscus triporus TaxID=2934178 RepID=A0ABD3NWF2_9STRA